MLLTGKKVILGISGGIAAYKAPFIIRLLKQQGASVQVVCTKNALEFVTIPVLETLSGQAVYHEVFTKNRSYSTEHISITDEADIMIVAPATGNIIGKFASGIADDALSTTYMAFNGPVFIAPAMNTKMWQSPVVQKNIAYLTSLGNHCIGPDEGDLACGYSGAGRMSEPEDILNALKESLMKKGLMGKHILITAGPTFERLDPVRYIGNFSSGKMGYALAKCCADRGASVTLVSGPVHLSPPHGVKLVQVESAKQMYDACTDAFTSCDAAIMAAAVADYRPEVQQKQKIKKGPNDSLSIALVKNPDILASLGQMKKKKQVLIGFALETENETENALQKLNNKKADMIVLNSLNDKNSGFGTDTNKISLVSGKNQIVSCPLTSKADAATVIVDQLELMLNSKK